MRLLTAASHCRRDVDRNRWLLSGTGVFGRAVRCQEVREDVSAVPQHMASHPMFSQRLQADGPSQEDLALLKKEPKFIKIQAEQMKDWLESSRCYSFMCACASIAPPRHTISGSHRGSSVAGRSWPAAARCLSDGRTASVAIRVDRAGYDRRETRLCGGMWPARGGLDRVERRRQRRDGAGPWRDGSPSR